MSTQPAPLAMALGLLLAAKVVNSRCVAVLNSIKAREEATRRMRAVVAGAPAPAPVPGAALPEPSPIMFQNAVSEDRGPGAPLDFGSNLSPSPARSLSISNRMGDRAAAAFMPKFADFDSYDAIVQYIYTNVDLVFAYLEEFREVSGVRLRDTLDPHHRGCVLVSELVKYARNNLPEVGPGNALRFRDALTANCSNGELRWSVLETALKNNRDLEAQLARPVKHPYLLRLMNVLGGEYEDIITEWFKGVQFLTHEQLWEHLYQQVPEVSQEDRTLMMDAMLDLTDQDGKVGLDSLLMVLLVVRLNEDPSNEAGTSKARLPRSAIFREEVSPGARSTATSKLVPRFDAFTLEDVVEYMYTNLDGIFAKLEAYRRRKGYRTTEMFFEIDRDRNGFLLATDVVEFVSKSLDGLSDIQLMRFYHYLDKNSDGQVSYKQVAESLKTNKEVEKAQRKKITHPCLVRLAKDMGMDMISKVAAFPTHKPAGFLSQRELWTCLHTELPHMSADDLTLVLDELLALVDQNGHVALHDIMLVLKVVSTFELTTLGDANYENSESDDASTQRGFDSLTPRFEHNTMEQVHNYIHANTDEIFAKLEAYRKRKGYRAVDMFLEMDKDRSGQLSIRELLRFIRKHFPEVTEDQVRRFDQFLDTNGDGKVSFKEIAEAMKHSKDMGRAIRYKQQHPHIQTLIKLLGEKMNDVLDLFPRSKQGFISKAKFQKSLLTMVPELSEEDVVKICSELFPIVVQKSNQHSVIAMRDVVLTLKAVSENN